MKPQKDPSPIPDVDLELPNPRWSVGDLIDYQHFLEEDHHSQVDSQNDRKERQQILDQLGVDPKRQNARLADTKSTRRAWFKKWVEQRRKDAHSVSKDEPESVGTLVEHTLSILTWICIFVAILTAAGVAASVVGTFSVGSIATEDRPYRPLDVMHALGYGLVPQVLLILFTVLAFLGRKANFRLPRPFQTLLFLGLRLYASFIVWLQGHAEVEETSRRMKAQLGKATGRLFSRKEIFSATLIHRLQWVGLIYSVTLVVAVTLSFTINARSFGWQSSLNLTPESIHQVTKWIAIPWSSFAPEGDGSPSLEQIRLTEFSEIKGFGEVEKEASKPWIRFLLYSLLFYTTLPRLLLWLITRAWKSACLARLDFSDVNDNTLFRRFKAPPFHIVAPAEMPEEALPSGIPRSPAKPASASLAPIPVMTQSALLILTDTPVDQRSVVSNEIAPKLQELHQWNLHQTYRAYSVHEQKVLVADLQAMRWEDGCARLVVVRRANHLVVAVKTLVERLLEIGGTSSQLVLCIGGSPNLFSDEIDPIHIHAWQNFANELKLRYPNVVVEVLGPLTSPHA